MTFLVRIGHAGNCADGRPGTTIFFLNGILGDSFEAETSKNSLEDKVKTAVKGTLKEQACLLFLVAYNPSSSGTKAIGLFGDLLESAQQLLGEKDGTTLLQEVLKGTSPIPLWMLQRVTSYTPSTLRQIVIPASARPVVDGHVTFYEATLADGNQIIIVSHSQGNMFANEEYNMLQQRGTLIPERVKVVSVATPDDHVGAAQSLQPYTTLCSDFIWRIPGALSFNVNNNIALCSSALPTALIWQHSFDSYYLKFVVSRTQIINQIVDAIQIPVAGTGTLFVKATLDGNDWSGGVNYRMTCGTAGVSGSIVPKSTNNMQSGSCTLAYGDGGPPTARLDGITSTGTPTPCPVISPPVVSCTQPLNSGQTLTFTIQFKTISPPDPPPTAAFTMSANGQTVSNGQTLTVSVAVPPATVTFSAAASQAFNGATITNWVWKANNSIIATTQTFLADFPVGTYSMSVVVTDSRGAQSSAATATVVVTDQSAPVWSQRFPLASPTARTGHQMVYDSARQEVVLFGGDSSAETWIWDGSNWIRRFPLASPPARSNHAMAYDAARSQTVVFGGMSSSGQLNDTWVWDGSNWTQKNPPFNPQAMDSAVAAYDTARQRVVMFGGYSLEFNTARNITWLWDGNQWTATSPATIPSARNFSSMAYDSARQQNVMFGGLYDRFILHSLGETWIWDGSNWIQSFPMTSPSPRSGSAMSYDQTRNKVILYDGYVADHLTWVWDGNNWVQTPTTGNPDVTGAAMVFDAARGETVLFGGTRSGIGNLANTWVLR
jgi:hypothetical protein